MGSELRICYAQPAASFTSLVSPLPVGISAAAPFASPAGLNTAVPLVSPTGVSTYAPFASPAGLNTAVPLVSSTGVSTSAPFASPAGFTAVVPPASLSTAAHPTLPAGFMTAVPLTSPATAATLSTFPFSISPATAASVSTFPLSTSPAGLSTVAETNQLQPTRQSSEPYHSDRLLISNIPSDWNKAALGMTIEDELPLDEDEFSLQSCSAGYVLMFSRPRTEQGMVKCVFIQHCLCIILLWVCVV